MIPNLINYLHRNAIDFRMTCHPAPEPLPAVAHRMPPQGVLVQSTLVVAGDRPVICCVEASATLVSLPRLSLLLGTPVLPGELWALSPPFRGLGVLLPPLGGLMDAATLLDERVASASCISFAAFSRRDVFDIPIDEFLRLERPRIEAITLAGELPEQADLG